MSWKDRLILPLIGNSDIRLFSRNSNIHLTTGYSRIVIGKRGPYVEFSKENIIWDHFRVLPKDLYRLDDPWIFYIEWRSKDSSNTKLYEQKKIVAYADYKIGMYYICPFDLYLIDGERVIN